jgi:outer membrane protein assembly factor BamB
LWSQPIGGGYASFVVADGRAFTIEQRRDHEAVTAYNVATGVELWAHSYPAAFSESMGGDGPRATPTCHEDRVYSLGAQGEFCCLDAVTGRLLWRKNVLDEAHATVLYFAMATSPLIVDDTVVVLSGEPLPPVKGATNRTVLAYHKRSGERVWSALADKLAYTSPMLVPLAGQRQLLVVAAKRIVGLKPEDGALQWEIPWEAQYHNSISQPVLVDTNRFVVSAGYGGGAMLVEISKSGPGFSARQVWKNFNLKNKFNSSVFSNGFVYGLDEGILTCIDAATGRRQWKDGRYGYGQLLLASGHLVVLSGDGELILVRANPDRHEEITRFQAIRGKTWNHPAIADGKIFVRNAVEMACFAISAP